MEFFNTFLDPNTIHTLSGSEKLLASIFVTLLGMGTTFVGLIVIQYLIGFMSKGVMAYENNAAKAAVKNVKAPEPQVSAPIAPVATKVEVVDDEEELIAVLTAAVAVMMQKSTSQIVIRNVRQVSGPSLAWSSAGRTEVMKSRL